MTQRPCLGVNGRRCPNLTTGSRCPACRAEFEAGRRSDPNLTGRRGTSAEWRRARGLALHRAGHRCERCGRCADQLPDNQYLEVHHVDGDHRNNRQGNLRVLCGGAGDTCHRVEQALVA